MSAQAHSEWGLIDRLSTSETMQVYLRAAQQGVLGGHVVAKIHFLPIVMILRERGNTCGAEDVAGEVNTLASFLLIADQSIFKNIIKRL